MYLTRYRNDGGVRKPSILHLPTSFPKQILTPSRFKLTLLINNGIDWKDHNSSSFWAENFGKSLEGQEGPTRGSKVSIQSFKWKPTTCAKTLKLRNSKKHFKQSPKAAKGWCAFVQQQTRRNEIMKSYLQLGSSSNRHAPACPNKKQNHLQNSLLRRTQFWVPKTFSKTNKKHYLWGCFGSRSSIVCVRHKGILCIWFGAILPQALSFGVVAWMLERMPVSWSKTA